MYSFVQMGKVKWCGVKGPEEGKVQVKHLSKYLKNKENYVMEQESSEDVESPAIEVLRNRAEDILVG